MPIPIAAIGLGLGLIGGAGRMFGRGRANRELAALMKKNPIYKENPLVKQRLGLAKQLLNARMPGAVQAERNIMGNQANTISAVERGATDASQLLATAGDVQGRTNTAFADLGITEAQDYQRRFENVTGAENAVINEQDKVFQDEVRRFEDMARIRGAMNQNRQDNWGEFSNMGFGLANFAMSGGFNSGQARSGGIRPLTTTGTYGYQGSLPPGIQNRRTPNFG